MGWPGNVGIGINADGRFYRNHNLSRSSNANRIACLNSPESDWSNVLYQLCMLLQLYKLTACECYVTFSDGDYLPFLELANETERVTLPSALDSKSSIITIPVAFSFGSTNFTSLSVSSHYSVSCWKE